MFAEEVAGDRAARSVAFVIPHPYVDALACFREPIKALADEGWQVDLFTTLSPVHPTPFFARENVSLIPIEMTRQGAASLVRRLITHRPKYRWIVTVPQWGLHYAGIAARLAGIPMGCISDELKSEAEATSRDKKRWKARERRAHQRCRWTIALSTARADFVRVENRLDDRHAIFVVPNSVPGRSVRLNSHYYQDVMSLPAGSRVLLHAGGLWWPPAQELIESAQAWESDWVLVVQARLSAQSNGRTEARNVRLSHSVLPASLLDYATSSATIGLALYDTNRTNNRLMGTASGKVSLYMKNSLPVITTVGSDFEWIEREGLGLCVSSVAEVTTAADRIWSEYDRYVTNVRRWYDSTLEFGRHFGPVLETMGRQ